MRTTSFLQRPSQHGLGSKIHSVLANIAPEKHLTWLKKKNSDKPSSLIVISTQLYQPTNKPKSPAERSTQNWPTSCLINIIMDIRSPLKIPTRMFRKHLFNKFLTTMSSSMVIFQRLKEWWPTQNTSFKVISICETKCWVDDKYMYSKITSPAISSSWLHNFHAGLTKSCLLKWFCAQCVCVIFINSLSLLFHVKYWNLVVFCVPKPFLNSMPTICYGLKGLMFSWKHRKNSFAGSGIFAFAQENFGPMFLPAFSVWCRAVLYERRIDVPNPHTSRVWRAKARVAKKISWFAKYGQIIIQHYSIVSITFFLALCLTKWR